MTITLSPSGAARRVACAGSRQLESLYPQDSSTYAQEGIAAHWVASELLRGNELPMTYNGHAITEEMLEGADLYAGFVNSKVNHGRSVWHIEEPLDISGIHPLCRGKPDAWIWDAGAREIHIFDYKFGHRFVDVYENWQMLEYAAGIIDALRIDGIDDLATMVNMHVIQPRSFHPDGQVRSWKTWASDLRPYFNILRNAEHAAMADNAPTTVSDQCNHCAARHACPALAGAAMSAVDVASSAVPHNLTAEQVSAELRFLEHASDLLSARISGLSAEALAMIQRGQRLPHYHAQRGQGRERWKIPVEEVVALGDLYGLELYKPKPITPKQAIALKSKMLTAETIREYSEVPVGELKLMQIDPRKADKSFGV